VSDSLAIAARSSLRRLPAEVYDEGSVSKYLGAHPPQLLC
jgi:hypothetical protein